MCAHHPELRADRGSCDRCGNFMCSYCQSIKAGTCARCYDRTIGRGMARHIPLLSILMMVHGGVLVLAGLFYAVMAVVMGGVMSQIPQPTNGAQGPPPEFFGFLFGGIYGFIGLAQALPGVLQLLAGFRLRTYRSRVFGIVACFSGLATILGCYCLPTAIGLCIFGLIVLFGDGTADRFRVAETEA